MRDLAWRCSAGFRDTRRASAMNAWWLLGAAGAPGDADPGHAPHARRHRVCGVTGIGGVGVAVLGIFVFGTAPRRCGCCASP